MQRTNEDAAPAGVLMGALAFEDGTVAIQGLDQAMRIRCAAITGGTGGLRRSAWIFTDAEAPGGSDFQVSPGDERDADGDGIACESR